MMGKSLLGISSLALAISTVLCAPTVRTPVIQRGHDCTSAPDNCASGLLCAGEEHAKICVTPKPAGMQCLVEPFWVCLPELTCESNVCKIPLGGDCAADEDQCVEGATCTTNGTGKTCEPATANLGESCAGDSVECDTALVCDADVCKLPKGRPCTDTPDLCASGTNCDGRDAEKRCIIYKAAGMECRADEPFWICQPGLTCENGVCKIAVGDDCSASPADCVEGSECTGSGSSQTCTPTLAKLGETCDSAADNCEDGLTCDGDVCKLERGQTCTDSPDLCASGLACDGKDSEKRCIIYKGAGDECRADEPFWICEAGLTCENEVCKIPVGEGCASSPTDCVDGSECTGSGSSATCSPTAAKLGDACDSRADNCEDGLTCDDHVCKLPKGQTCTDTPDLCASGLNCDGKGTEKRCIIYKAAGMECRADEPFWVCESGLTCDDDTCRVPVGGSCSASPEDCVSGATCRGSGRRKVCALTPRDAGETCDNSDECARGLTCDGTCRLGSGARCETTPTLCARGLTCMGTRRSKVCLEGRGEGRRCGTIGQLQCDSGLVCERNRCVRGTVGEHGRCGAGHVCKAGLVCAGDSGSRLCVVPMGSGKKCGIEPYWVCAPGSRCVHNRCREY